jgi:hypothetical protein
MKSYPGPQPGFDTKGSRPGNPAYSENVAVCDFQNEHRNSEDPFITPLPSNSPSIESLPDNGSQPDVETEKKRFLDHYTYIALLHAEQKSNHLDCSSSLGLRDRRLYLADHDSNIESPPNSSSEALLPRVSNYGNQHSSLYHFDDAMRAANHQQSSTSRERHLHREPRLYLFNFL